MAYKVETVGLLSPGDMGHSVGQTLRENGLRVITCLQGRSERTRGLAAEAGIEDVPTYGALVQEADLILSILVPAQAGNAAHRVAEAISETGVKVVYADCNAIAPQTVRAIGEEIVSAGGQFVDASIIGGPPRGGSSPRVYVSGPDTRPFEALGRYGLHVIPIGAEIGLASAIKMCYAGWTKGSTALLTEILTAAKVLGVFDALQQEYERSQSALIRRMQGLPAMPIKSRRFVGEMEEIAKTFGHVGLTPNIHSGAADMYRLVGSTHLADRTPEDTSPLPSLEETLAALADALPRSGGDEGSS
ncbi:MAG: NAD(P)-dependent oxidoreductase [Anaerolineae bacterium]|nr:NAD(P)-dependent oxidoreductase [Anaerolineae bacterium]